MCLWGNLVNFKSIQVHQMLGKLRKTWCFRMICGSGGSKTVGLLKRRLRSHLARWEMKNCTPLWWEARSLLPEGTWRPRSKSHVIKTHCWRIDLSILSVSIPENKKLKIQKGKVASQKGKVQRSGQIIIFNQPRFPWNKGISLTKPPFGVRSCEVAIIWPERLCLIAKLTTANNWN